ncbi:glutaredoxin family protein [Flavobacterium paronense]|uniref:Glutaredoxin family protein n=1 Tax=Flavobacterium paronense TaxID=1392775 RepID=A0ABV5GFR6_9FLAO|nr:glutaredoxin family protein [Flavobacterium paronense]MDN3676101.1 glutaredoxin family protein [Flavobacterium paronense]
MKKILFIFFFSTAIFRCDVYAQNTTTAVEIKKEKPMLILYGSDVCDHCIATQKYLKDNNIEFKFYDIDKNPEALKEMLFKLRNAKISTNNLGIPVVDKAGVLFTNVGGFEEFLEKLK